MWEWAFEIFHVCGYLHIAQLITHISVCNWWDFFGNTYLLYLFYVFCYLILFSTYLANNMHFLSAILIILFLKLFINFSENYLGISLLWWSCFENRIVFYPHILGVKVILNGSAGYERSLNSTTLSFSSFFQEILA